MKGNMMKKLFLLFLLFFTTDLHSSGIATNAASAPCTNNTLETYSGNSNLSADWQPNEIKLRWYNGNTLMNVQTAANTCTYDDVLNVPSTAPTRTGYTFTGWTVRPEIDFATTIPLDENGTNRWAIGVYGNTNNCWYDTNTQSAWTVDCNSDPTYKELQTYEWKVRFSHGDLYGMSGCSTVSGVAGQPGTPTIGSGQYCWCKATGYKAANTNVISGPASALSWIYFFDWGSVFSCAKSCAPVCALYAMINTENRTALFTPAAQ